MDAVDIWRWLDCDRWPIVLKMEIFRYSDVDIPNLTMDDPSGESWGDLDLFMSWNWRFGYSGTIRGFLCSHRRMPLMITTIVPQIFHLLSLDFFFMDSLPPNASPALS